VSLLRELPEQGTRLQLPEYEFHGVSAGHRRRRAAAPADPLAHPPKTLGFRTDAGQPILDALGQFFRNIVFWLAPPPAMMATWYHLVARAVSSVSLRESAPRRGQKENVREFGAVVFNRVLARIPEPIAWTLASAQLDKGAVKAIASGKPTPCAPSDTGVPDRRTIAHHLAGAAAVEVLAATKGKPPAPADPKKPATRDRKAQEEAHKIISASHHHGLQILAAATLGEAKRKELWAETLQQALAGKDVR